MPSSARNFGASNNPTDTDARIDALDQQAIRILSSGDNDFFDLIDVVSSFNKKTITIIIFGFIYI